MVRKCVIKLWVFWYLIAGLMASAWANNTSWNMPRGVTTMSHEIYRLHMIIFWICVVIAIIVFSILLYALIFHRKSRGAVAADFHEHLSLEVVWAIIPFIILIAMAVPATRVLINIYDASEADVTIKITGFQWKWKYDYLNEGISFFSNLGTPYVQIHDAKLPKNRWYLLEVDKPIVVPVNKKIRFLVTGNDVIHSWWVPELGIKRDAIPGFIHESWANIDMIGTYRGQCAELCGINHAYMPIVVEAVSEMDYKKWVAKQRGEEYPPIPKATITAAAALVAKPAEKPWDRVSLLEEGKKVYERACVVCHKADGSGQPPIFPPLKGSSIAVGKPIDRHIDRVLWGVKGTAMQAFADQLTTDEIAAVVTYERNAFGNKTGDMVYPKDVTARKTAKPN